MYLVVKKTSQLDIRGKAIKKMVDRGVMSDEYLKRLEDAHADHVKTYGLLVSELTEKKIQFTEVQRGEIWPDLSTIKAVITVGGDGTVLEASHEIEDKKVPLIGVRSSQMSVGFLCYVSESEISELAEQLKADTVNFIGVERLYAKVLKYNGRELITPPVLNDFLYTNKNAAETTRYSFEFEGGKELHKSSGIWIATAAGSTAAISAAGGKVYPIEHREFQFSIREPYCPPGGCYLKTKGDFTPEANNIVIENRCESALLALDGHHGHIELEIGDRVTFERASQLMIARKP